MTAPLHNHEKNVEKTCEIENVASVRAKQKTWAHHLETTYIVISPPSKLRSILLG
jgi:hypothetical protein